MKRLLFAALITLATATAAPALADPGDPNCSHGGYSCTPWPGQLQPTWDVPPYGSNGTPVMCDPGDISCRRYIP